MPQPETMKSAIECCGIRCSEQNLSEIDTGKIMVTVPRQEVRRITLRHGTQAPHPVLQFVMGLALIGPGYFPARHLVHWLRHGGTFLSDELWIIPFVVAGVWMAFSAFSRGYFLEVELQQGSKRLAFDHEPAFTELEKFLGNVEKCYGLAIVRKV